MSFKFCILYFEFWNLEFGIWDYHGFQDSKPMPGQRPAGNETRPGF